jgi:hypothetical protein
MRKELTVYVNTSEEGEEVIVQRVADDPTFVLLRLGQSRMVINKAELLEAISCIEYYSAAFDQEKVVLENRTKLEASRTAAKGRVLEILPASKAPRTTATKKATSSEEEGTLILDQDFSRGPTESELALEGITKHMQGPEITITEKE